MSSESADAVIGNLEGAEYTVSRVSEPTFTETVSQMETVLVIERA